MPNSNPRSKTSGSTTSGSASEKPLFALRPNIGISGKNINIFANHFSMKYTSDITVYHYDIDMEPMRIDDELARMTFDDTEDGAKKKFKKLNNKINRIVVEEAIKHYSEAGDIFDGIVPVYDGQKNLYSRQRLNLDKYSSSRQNGSTNGSLNNSFGGDDTRIVARIQVAVNYDGREVNYALNIKFASIIDMSSLKRYFDGKTVVVPSDAIQVLNIILRHAPTMYKIPIANSLYAPFNEAGGTRKNIGGGRQLAYGYFQSVRLESNGVSLVIDRTATALYDSGPVAKFVANIMNISREQFMAMKDPMKDSDRRRVEKELTGIMVQVRHLTYKRKYKVIGLTKDAANKVEFEHKKTDPRGKEHSVGVISLIDFFKNNYPNIAIRFGHLPAIKVGSTKNPNYLPMDVCELVPDQHVRKNLTNDQMVEMIRSSASQSPAQRLEFIKESAKSTIIESKTYLKEFGITFLSNNTPLRIEARVLTPPPLIYGDRRIMNPFDGKWDVRNQSFYEAASLEHWIIIGFSEKAENKSRMLERNLMDAGKRLGMNILQATKHVTLRNYGPETISNIFKKAMEVTGRRLQMIFFIISPRYQYLYESIKKVGDVDYGVVTQCIKEANLDNLKPPLMQNIMLKINTKLGGINAVLKDIEVLKKRTMIVGVDSSHPGVGDRVSRSVSACVASIDESYVKYFATTRLQKRVQEINKELQEMMGDLLTEYSVRNNGMLPEQIIIYRDGVSEGQFNAALQSEIKALTTTFAQKREGYEPKVTYIVVQKRHHTRFFPQNTAEGVGRAKNVPPGLVVDTDVVSKTHFDYFLCSHEGIQGTSRPTHYFILWDDNELSADQLQQLTFSLTHIYARCTRSISYPAPIAYAHLAAYRAQRHIIGHKQSEDSESDSFGGSSAGFAAPRRHPTDEGLSDKMQISKDFKTKMYFC